MRTFTLPRPPHVAEAPLAVVQSLTRLLALAPSRYDRQIGMARDRLAQLQ